MQATHDSIARHAYILDSSLQSRHHTLSAKGFSSSDFTEEELHWIAELALSEQALYLLAQQLCPRIFGQELVKAGLLMALFGGSAQEGSQQQSMRSWSVRSNIHVLIVGDPGLGKVLYRQSFRLEGRGAYSRLCAVESVAASCMRYCTERYLGHRQ